MIENKKITNKETSVKVKPENLRKQIDKDDQKNNGKNKNNSDSNSTMSIYPATTTPIIQFKDEDYGHPNMTGERGFSPPPVNEYRSQIADLEKTVERLDTEYDLLHKA